MTASYQLAVDHLQTTSFAVDHPKARAQGPGRSIGSGGATIIVSSSTPLMKSARHAIHYDHRARQDDQ